MVFDRSWTNFASALMSRESGVFGRIESGLIEKKPLSVVFSFWPPKNSRYPRTDSLFGDSMHPCIILVLASKAFKLVYALAAKMVVIKYKIVRMVATS